MLINDRIPENVEPNCWAVAQNTMEGYPATVFPAYVSAKLGSWVKMSWGWSKNYIMNVKFHKRNALKVRECKEHGYHLADAPDCEFENPAEYGILEEKITNLMPVNYRASFLWNVHKKDGYIFNLPVGAVSEILANYLEIETTISGISCFTAPELFKEVKRRVQVAPAFPDYRSNAENVLRVGEVHPVCFKEGRNGPLTKISGIYTFPHYGYEPLLISKTLVVITKELNSVIKNDECWMDDDYGWGCGYGTRSYIKATNFVTKCPTASDVDPNWLEKLAALKQAELEQVEEAKKALAEVASVQDVRKEKKDARSVIAAAVKGDQCSALALALQKAVQ